MLDGARARNCGAAGVEVLAWIALQSGGFSQQAIAPAPYLLVVRPCDDRHLLYADTRCQVGDAVGNLCTVAKESLVPEFSYPCRLTR